jgi:predicted lipoprotein
MLRSIRTVLGLALVVILAFSCTKQESDKSTEIKVDYRQVALEFTKSLATRDYAKAYAMAAEEYRKRTSLDQMRTAFEAIVPTDWGKIGAIQVGDTMTTWPTKKPSDLGRAYVSIGGDVYSEAVVVVVTLDSGGPKIREVEFGRP